MVCERNLFLISRLGSIDTLLKKIWRTITIDGQSGCGRLHSVHVNDIEKSQTLCSAQAGRQSKTYQSIREISLETSYLKLAFLHETWNMVFSTQQPAYLYNLISYHQPSRLLHSSSQSLLQVPRVKTDFGHRAFSSAAPHHNFLTT